MARFILVHGAFHGSWCWERVQPILEQMGHRADCADLPGLGHACASTPEDWMEVWSGAVATLLADPEPAILVGHSRAGIIISHTAERNPDKVRGLVYLAALVTNDGQSASDLRASLGELARSPVRLDISEDGLCASVAADTLIEAAYCDADPGDLDAVRERLVPEPVAGFAIVPRLSNARFGQLPRIYLECLRDRAVGIGFQREMQRMLPGFETITLDTDHAPYWSDPHGLCLLLDRCARRLVAHDGGI